MSGKKNKTKSVNDKKKKSSKTVDTPEKKILENQIIEIPKDTNVQEEIVEEKIVEAPLETQPAEKKLKQKSKSQKISDPENIVDEKNKIEALLFAAGKYLTDDTIAELCDIDKRGLKKILEELQKDYESKNTALMIFNEGNSWKINVREKYLSIVRKIVADTELPRSVMETLAVIAWKSPIYQSEVVKIRGNKCYDHIDLLEETGFVTKDKKGRSYVLKTNEKFFTYFEIDDGNIKGLFDTVKVPEIKEEQKTLENTDLIKDDEQNKVAAIELRKWNETDEEKQGHTVFLEKIEEKIREVQEKNKALDEEIPRPTLNQPTIPQIDQTQDNEKELENSNITPTGNTENAGQEIIENADTPHKPKSLTKKQLEKKFREELLKVREKMEKKGK